MTYSHGVYISENPTSVLAPIVADSAVQVVVGTAPIHLLADPSSAVNVPLIVNTFAEAVSKFGYSDDFEKFTLCQSVDASFRVYNVAPLVLINVLDPAVHKVDVVAALHDLVDKKVTIAVDGILLDANLVVKNQAGDTTYIKNTDYTVAHNTDGYPVITLLTHLTDTKLSIAYRKLDPTLVDAADIIGGYDVATAKYTGLENISQIYPKYGILPGLLIAPGWSHIPEVGMAILAKTTSINGSFSCYSLLDVDTEAVTTYDDVKTWKDTNGYSDVNADVCFPMVKIGAKKYYFSAVQAALTAFTDAKNQNVPFVSPSNKALRISGAILKDGTEVFLDQLQGNTLNGAGITTAINLNGWKSWGNNTSAYPNTTDVKDRWKAIKRMFIWWGNSFILTYFQKVDDPMNLRLIETVVDSENIRANGYKARTQIASAKIEFNINENPITDILGGVIRFKQYLTPFPPAETIINTLEFDPSALQASLTGGE